MNRPDNTEEAAEFVRSADRVSPAGAGTKRPRKSSAATLDLTGLTGIVEYDPSEYTFTALAGTPISEINEALRENGQYLPFDPPLVDAGATLGGTIACGLSGPGRLRYGGLRDFLIGIRFINGEGTVIQGGGKVVKNAAGFDYPKLFCGAMGTLGILVETTFKVFPAPRATRTLELQFPNMDTAIDTLCEITLTQWEPDALEFFPRHNLLLLRLAGNPDALEARIPAILRQLAGCRVQQLSETEATARWCSLLEFEWNSLEATLLKVPITPSKIPSLDKALAERAIGRHYGMAGNMAWLAISGHTEVEEVSAILEKEELSALAIRGDTPRLAYGKRARHNVQNALKQALDPQNKFPEFQ